MVEGDKGKPHVVQTDGINFQAVFAFDDHVDVNELTSNNIHSMLNTYGVEAARQTIVNECRNVFGAYGISVNPRHLGLISDHMTNLVGSHNLSCCCSEHSGIGRLENLIGIL